MIYNSQGGEVIIMQDNHFPRILVAIDGSTPSMHTTDYAISLP